MEEQEPPDAKDAMTATREALTRAICAQPDEDTPRLAFADLVEEEGESARAEFIRAQVMLARVADHDPLAISTMQALPDAGTGHGMAHTLPRMPEGYSWSAFEFRRGFPWKVGVNSSAAFDAEGQVFNVAPVRALDIGSAEQPLIELLAEWPHLIRIHRLDCASARLGVAEIDAIGRSLFATTLTELACDYDGITAEGLAALVRTPLFRRLDSLDLGYCAMPPELIVDALAGQGTTSLARLSLAGDRLDGIDLSHLLALPIAQNFRHLRLSDNPLLGTDGAKALARSLVTRRLESLDLERTHPGVEGIRVLAESGALPALRSLNLAANRLGPTAIKRLAELKLLRRLRVLNLSTNPIGDAGAMALSSARGLSGLLDLDLAETRITDTGALALAASPHLGGLLRLNLRMNDANAEPLGPKARFALTERFGTRVNL